MKIRGIRSIKDNIDEHISKKETAVFLTMERYSKEMEAYMKERAKWTDRTGLARKGLWGSAGKDKNGFVLYISFDKGTHYGRFLEANDNYSIIEPTYNLYKNEVINRIKRVWER